VEGVYGHGFAWSFGLLVDIHGGLDNINQKNLVTGSCAAELQFYII